MGTYLCQNAAFIRVEHSRLFLESLVPQELVYQYEPKPPTQDPEQEISTIVQRHHSLPGRLTPRFLQTSYTSRRLMLDATSGVNGTSLDLWENNPPPDQGNYILHANIPLRHHAELIEWCAQTTFADWERLFKLCKFREVAVQQAMKVPLEFD